MLKIAITAVFSALVTSIFWVWVYSQPNAAREPNGTLSAAGDIATVKPPRSGPVAIAEGLEVGPAGLAIPVIGVKPEQLTDTFTQARAGGARRHDAIDVMAPEGTPVIAAAPGTVEKLYFSNGGGGNTIYVRSPDQRLDLLLRPSFGLCARARRRPAGAAGPGHRAASAIPAMPIAAGPHLHFAINQMAPGERWWQGTPINPYPLLAGKKAGG